MTSGRKLLFVTLHSLNAMDKPAYLLSVRGYLIKEAHNFQDCVWECLRCDR